MKGTGITKMLFLVALFGCVVDAPILDNVHILEVLKDDKCLGVTVKTGILRDKDKKVIVKISQSGEKCTKERAIERGQNEYQALMKINSPYIIKAIEGEEHDGKYVLMEEYFDGYTIDRLPWGYYDIEYVYKILSQFGEGIDVIHKNGIVHNDLHLGNLMIGNDNTQDIIVKIIDFDKHGNTVEVDAKSTDWKWFGEYMYELFTGEKTKFGDALSGISYPELPNLDSRLSSLVKALCISETIKTYDDYLDVLKSHNWETGEKLLIGMKACLTDANRV